MMIQHLSQKLPAVLSEKVQRNKNDQIFKIDIVHQQSASIDNITEFWFRPTNDIKINRVEIRLGLFEDEIIADAQTIFEKKQWHQLVGYENVQNGQKWRFVIFGLYIEKNIRFTKVCKYTIKLN